MLLLSAPGRGKTTILRDLARSLSEDKIVNILINDERNEITAAYRDFSLDTGAFCDVIRYSYKRDALIAAAKGETEIPDSFPKLPYTVQCGAFADTDNAAKLYAKLDDKGYFAFLQNEATIKVCVGKFASSEEAQRTCDDLKKKGFAGFVTTI